MADYLAPNADDVMAKTPKTHDAVHRRRRELVRKLRSYHARTSEKRDKSKEPARQVVRRYLSTLLPPHQSAPATTPSLTDDLERVKSVVVSIERAKEKGILTVEEANSVIDLIVSKFVERRIDEAVSHIIQPSEDAWFFVGASGSIHGSRRRSHAFLTERAGGEGTA